MIGPFLNAWRAKRVSVAGRSLPWHQRREAAALLAEASGPDRRFDAVVIGEHERAFAVWQALQIISYLQSHGVAVWLPEARRRPVDLAEPTHQPTAPGPHRIMTVSPAPDSKRRLR